MMWKNEVGSMGRPTTTTLKPLPHGRGSDQDHCSRAVAPNRIVGLIEPVGSRLSRTSVVYHNYATL